MALFEIPLAMVLGLALVCEASIISLTTRISFILREMEKS
jgi:hypothetical protein